MTTIHTRNTRYHIADLGDGGILISGNAEFCPTPSRAVLMAEPSIGRGMWFQILDGHYIDQYPDRVGHRIHTSPVVSIEQADGAHPADGERF